MRRSQVNRRSWDDAIWAVQWSMLELAASVPLTDEQDQILTAAFRRAEELTAKKHFPYLPTNRELAAKYGTCERTIRNWRRERCPFAKGQWHVLKWVVRHRCAPAGTRAKFGKRLEELKWKAIFAELPVYLANFRHVKWLYREAGEQPPDWLRNFRAKRGKLDFCGYVTTEEREAFRTGKGSV